MARRCLFIKWSIENPDAVFLFIHEEIVDVWNSSTECAIYYLRTKTSLPLALRSFLALILLHTFLRFLSGHDMPYHLRR